LKKTEKAKNEFFQSSQHWQNQYQASQKLLDNQTKQLIDNQVDIKLLLQQLSDIKKLANNLQDQNKLLSHEKWALSQEKSELEGQLK
jgi:hypothetical protein